MVPDRGGAEFQTAGILLYVEDLKRGTNKDMGPKDIFEMGSNKMALLYLLTNRPFDHEVVFDNGCNMIVEEIVFNLPYFTIVLDIEMMYAHDPANPAF